MLVLPAHHHLYQMTVLGNVCIDVNDKVSVDHWRNIQDVYLQMINRGSRINNHGLNNIFCFHDKVGPPRLSKPPQVIKEAIAPHILMHSHLHNNSLTLG